MIAIDDEYAINSDGTQFVLYQKVKPKKKGKKEYYKPVAYCGTVKQALTAYNRRTQLEAFMSDDIKKIMSALDTIEEIIRGIKE